MKAIPYYTDSIFIFLAFVMAQCATTNASFDCEQLIISPIADHEILVNTRCYIPLAVVANHLDQVSFKIPESHDFISIKETQRGRAFLQIDANNSHLGNHSIRLEANNSKHEACISFNIQITESKEIDRIIHCNPSNSTNGNGNVENPYGSLSQLLASGFKPKKKDLILLHGGNHGEVVLSGAGYKVAAFHGNNARLTKLQISNGNEIDVIGLEIRPENNHGNHDSYLVKIDSSAQQINFANNIVWSIPNADEWTHADWDKKASRGIKCTADDSKIHSNFVQHVFHGIKTEGNKISTSYNHVDRFGGDAVRNTGSFNSYSYNFLTNATIDDYYDEDGNHDDLFQSWTFDAPIDNIHLNNNIMISCLDTMMKLRSKIVQGLVCFDGFETNWIVENNLIVTDHPHGIALYGAENCQVFENMVLKNPNNLYQYESEPWIMINNHKDGRESKNNIVRDNVTTALNIVSKDVKLNQNIVLDSSSLMQLNQYHDWDFRLKE